MNKTYRLFISHSWAYSDYYNQIINLINNQGLNYYDHSVPKDDPIHTNGTDKQLKEAIELKIKGTSCIIILAGIYATHSKWINKEIELAKAMGKKIIAVQPWGAERTSKVVKDNADIIVGWNGKSIVDAIKSFG